MPRTLVRTLTSLPLLLLLPLLITACAKGEADRLSVRVIQEYPHDPGAFTQGLLLAHGYLYESTGLVGRSSIREVELATGEVVRLRELPPPHFGEGLELVGDELWQLTWKSGILYRYDRETFQPLGEFRYDGEGWGLCLDGNDLYMTNGTATLYKRDPSTFEVKERVQVTLNGEPRSQLNELECVNGKVYANVWLTDEIVRIDPASGRIEAVIDASPLHAAFPDSEQKAELNGIAYDPESGHFLLTGKLWSKLFAVKFE